LLGIVWFMMAGRLVGLGFLFFPRVLEWSWLNCAECILHRLVGWIGTVHDLLGRKNQVWPYLFHCKKSQHKRTRFIDPKTSISYKTLFWEWKRQVSRRWVEDTYLKIMIYLFSLISQLNILNHLHSLTSSASCKPFSISLENIRTPRYGQKVFKNSDSFFFFCQKKKTLILVNPKYL